MRQTEERICDAQSDSGGRQLLRGAQQWGGGRKPAQAAASTRGAERYVLAWGTPPSSAICGVQKLACGSCTVPPVFHWRAALGKECTVFLVPHCASAQLLRTAIGKEAWKRLRNA